MTSADFISLTAAIDQRLRILRLSRAEPTGPGRACSPTLRFSDGIPTVGATDEAALVPGVTFLLEQLRDRVAEIHFNTLFLGGDEELTTEEEAEAARGLLEKMAGSGDGSFTDIPAGETFGFDIEIESITTQFELIGAMASNGQARLGQELPIADSDGDGLPDLTELALGLDPTSRDSDGDGFGDGVELVLPGQLSALDADGGCENTEDKDGDGLLDCEELSLGTLSDDPDTDDDRIPDAFEIFLGTSPLANDPVLDADLDGIPDQAEAVMHLAPRSPNPSSQVDEWAYRYTASEKKEGDPDQPPCYAVSVDNLWMSETLETETEEAGVNTIDLIAVFWANSREDSVRFLRARVTGRYIGPELQEPADGIFTIEDKDFAPLAP